ncbi:hypothetical protein JXA56_03970 [Candidatus Micrarchaeota archaeon]|nr:hypothetical protein [Candidatus Micrarchaeota archaeon]
MRRRGAYGAKTAAAAVLGLATFVASPEHIFKDPASIFTSGVIMAQAQVKKPETEGMFTQSQLLSMIDILGGPTSRATHPIKANNAYSSATNCLKIWQVLRIVSGPKPAASSNNRAIYDRAVDLLGAGDRDAAIVSLSAALNDSLEKTEKLAPKSKSDFGDRATAFEKMLRQIDAGANADKEKLYSGLRPARGSITALIRVFEGAPVATTARTQDAPTTSEAIPIVVPPMHDLGPIILVDSGKKDSVVTINGQPPAAFLTLFSSQEDAQGAVNAIASAYATRANHPNDQDAHRTAAQRLHTALSRVPDSREVWQSPNFQAAMRALQAGDLDSGLRELLNDPRFNAAMNDLSNLYVISVSQRAVSVMRAGLTIRYEFDQNLQAFEEFRRGTKKGVFQPQVIWLALALEYSYYVMNGQLSQLRPVQGASGELGLERVGGRPLRGSGHRLGITPQIAVGTSFWGQPTEIILHATAGYDQSKIQATIQNENGTTERLSTGGQGMFIGLIGTEVRFRGKEGDINTVRVENIGGGIVPTGILDRDATPRANPLGYITFSGNWAESNKLTLRTLLTPQYSYFLEEHRAGAQLKPVDLTMQAHPDWTLYGGPSFRYEYNINGKVSTYDVGASLGLRYKRKGALELGTGYVFEKGGDESQRIPSTVYGSVNLTLNLPELFMREPATKRKMEATPKKTTTATTTAGTASAGTSTKTKGGESK